ncbi:MAG: hypothetical protein WC740_07245 [Verrucomicrobiia bacterium]
MCRIWVFTLLLAGVGFAAEPVTRSYPLGIADPEEVMEQAKLLTSPAAKVWLNPQHTQLCVTDTADRLASIVPLIQSLQRPPRNITLHVRYPDFVTLPNTTQTAGISGGDRTGLTGMQSSPFGPGKIRFGGPPPPVVSPGERRGAPAPTPRPAANETSVVVPSGKGAWLMVSPAAPNAGWLFQWGIGRNLWPATPRWTQVKANLYVVPKLRGESIRLQMMPAVSFMAGVTQRNLALESMMLEKTVANGEEVEVSNASGSGEEFHRNFFATYDRNRQPVPMQLWITPTVQ